MRVETTRLLLKNALLSDAGFFLRLMNSSNWLQFIGDRGIDSLLKAEDYIENNIKRSYRNFGFGLYVMCLKKTEIPIGICGFVKRDYLKNPDIGFAILPEFENEGYTSEAALEVIHYGKTHLKLDTILGVTTNENVGSKRILKKIGLSKIDTIKPAGSETVFQLFSTP